MSTVADAIAALIAVGEAYFSANSADPTYGTMFRTTTWQATFPSAAFNGPRVAIYAIGGTDAAKSLGYVAAWHQGRLRLDLMGRNYAEAEQMAAAIWLAWRNDFDASPWLATAGSGYLRTIGAIKSLQFGGERATGDERASFAFFRRIVDFSIEYGD